MPHPPILRGVQQLVDALRQAGHTVVEWKPYKHQYGVGLASKLLSADGGVSNRRTLALTGEPPVPLLKQVVESNSTGLDLRTVWALQSEKTTYQREYLAVWQQQPHIDGWIQPVAPHAAVKHDEYKYYGYSTIINLLDWPAVTIPVTFADKNRDVKDPQYKGISELDTTIHQDYDADIYHGAPVAVQLVGKRLQEEYLLGLAEQLGLALHA